MSYIKAVNQEGITKNFSNYEIDSAIAFAGKSGKLTRIYIGGAS